MTRDRRKYDNERYKKDPNRKRSLIANNKRLRKERKEKLIKILGGKCSVCGYDKCSDALCFHHVDSSEKEFSLSKNNLCKAWSRVLAEAKKCILVCANCHLELHASNSVGRELV